jgi:hypothetical protein
MTQLEGSEVYIRTIKFSWIKPIMLGELKPEDETQFLIDLVQKCVCDKDGKAIEDLDLDDFMKAQALITTKMNPEKKS